MPQEAKYFYEFSSFRLDAARRVLLMEAQHVPLAPKVFETLLVLVQRRGQVVEKDELMKLLWPDSFVEEANLTQNVSILRKVLGESPNDHRYIVTVPGRGYRFVAEVRESGHEETQLIIEERTRTHIVVSEEDKESPPRQIGSALLATEDQLASIHEPAVAISGKSGLPVLVRPRIALWLLRLTGAVVSALVVVGLGWYAWQRTGPSTELTQRQLTTNSSETPVTAAAISVPLTSYPGRETSPSFSPDGNQVVFAWNGERQDNFDIYVKLIGSGLPLRLTSHPAEDLSPAWSPDGRWIAFLRNLPGGKAAVVLIPPIGGPERKLAEIYSPHSTGSFVVGPFLAWSPDGNWLVVVDQDSSNEPSGLFLLSIETGEKRRLTSPPAQSDGDSSPAFSPDGHTLAFSRSSSWATSDLYLLALSKDLKATGEPKRLTFDNRETSSPVWTLDGRKIIFSSGVYGGRGGMWEMAASGAGGPQQLASFGEEVSHPAISRQGHRLAYERYLADRNIWRVEIPRSHGKTNPPTKFISSTRYDSQAQYSPDGKKIAFGSDRSGSNEVWVCDSDGSNALQVTSSGGALSIDPRWSPDSQRLVFGSNGEGQPEIYVVSINGGKPQRLTSDPANDENPCWSHDGRWIYFDSNRNGEGIWKVPAQGGEALQVTRNGFGPIESPDGIFVFYHQKGLDGNISLWKVPVEGGEERQVLEVPIVWFSFAITDEGIYFAPKAESAGDSIQFFSFATRSVKQIATIDKFCGYGLSVSPDRRWIIYSQLDQAGSDLMLMENFH